MDFLESLNYTFQITRLVLKFFDSSAPNSGSRNESGIDFSCPVNSKCERVSRGSMSSAVVSSHHFIQMVIPIIHSSTAEDTSACSAASCSVSRPIHLWLDDGQWNELESTVEALMNPLATFATNCGPLSELHY